MIAYLNGNRVNDVHFHQGGGSGSGGNIFAEIGYTETPPTIQDGIDYAKEIQANWDASITNRENAFSGDTKLVFFPAVDTSNVTNMYQFARLSNIIYFPVNIDTSNVTNMSSMFSNCYELKSLDLNNFNTSNVTNMSSMFSRCENLTSLGLSNWNTSNVTDMSYMFNQCSGLTSLDVSSFDTSNVTNMKYMFHDCIKLTTLDLSNFNTSKVTNMSTMFYNCDSLKSLDLNSFDTSKVTDMSNMFESSWQLERVCGKIDCSSINFSYNFSPVGYSNSDYLRQITFSNLGAKSGLTTTSTSLRNITNWGVNSDDIPDARQSLIDSLITYSFDRASAEYSTCTITLSAISKAVLTDDEIAQITSKGFTIA